MLDVKIIRDGQKQVTTVGGFVIGCTCCDEPMTASFAGDQGKEKYVIFTDQKEALREAVAAGSDRIVKVQMVIEKIYENKKDSTLLPNNSEGDHAAVSGGSSS